MTTRTSLFILFIICLQTLYNCIVSIIGQYIYQYYLHLYPHHPSNLSISLHSWRSIYGEIQQEQCSSIINNTETKNDSSAEVWAQQQSADLLFGMTLWRAFPVIIVTYLFGVYVSKINRCLVLVVSIFGNGLHILIYQGLIYGYLGETWWYISAFTAGVSGGTNVISIVVNLILVETSEEHQRSTRFVRFSALTTGLSALATLGIGYYIQWRGFRDLFWMALAIEVMSILVVIFFFVFPHRSSSSSTTDERTSLLPPIISNEERQAVTCSSWNLCSMLSCRHGMDKRRWSIWLTLVSYMFHYLSLSCLSPLLWYLLSAPFCWKSKDLGFFAAFSSISTAVLSLIGMKIMTSCCGVVNDALICMIGHACLIGYTLCLALAKTSWQVYVSVLINSFSMYQSTLTMPMLSKWVDSDVGRSEMFTVVTEVNTIFLAFGSSISNWIYARTVSHQKNFILLLASGLSIVPFILNICLYTLTRRVSSESNCSDQRVLVIDPPVPILLPSSEEVTAMTSNMAPCAMVSTHLIDEHSQLINNDNDDATAVNI